MRRPRYTEDEDLIYEVDEWFVDQIKQYPSLLALCIAKQIDKAAPQLPKLDDWSQKAGGVCIENGEAVFYEVEYLNEIGEVPIFIDINIIESDDYLDYILDKKIIKFNDKTNSTNTNTEGAKRSS